MSRSALWPRITSQLLPVTPAGINAYGEKISYRTDDDQALNPLRHQRSGVRHRKDLWEIRFDPYDVSRVWVRDHWRGGWITLFWQQLHRVAAPFGELAWDHTRRARPQATEEELADAVADLLGKWPITGPAGEDRSGGAQPQGPARRRPDQGQPARPHRSRARTSRTTNSEPGHRDGDSRQESTATVIPMPIFDPFAEADKRW